MDGQEPRDIQPGDIIEPDGTIRPPTRWESLRWRYLYPFLRFLFFPVAFPLLLLHLLARRFGYVFAFQLRWQRRSYALNADIRYVRGEPGEEPHYAHVRVQLLPIDMILSVEW